ncbi:MAG: class I SAM-dependent methyltransferase [Planctomycetota bacterium]
MKLFHSLDEFRDFTAGLAADGDETERIEVLSNSFLVDPVIVEMPADPFSDAYRRAVLDIHARISGRPCYDATTMEHTPLDVAAFVARPAAYQYDSRWLGNYLESFGHVIKKLDVRPGMRVIEFGCGDAELSLHLARFGCDVTVVDIEPDYLKIVRRKADRMEVPIRTVLGDFTDGIDLEPFDRIFFYQAFHHSLEHQQAIANYARMLRADGFLVFGAEPVIDPAGPWSRAVPYPWGPRLDGLSLRAMQTHGWMELGFQKPYFDRLLARNGLGCDQESALGNSLASSIVARRLVTAIPATPSCIHDPFQEQSADLARDWRGAMLTIVGMSDGDWFASQGREGVVLYGPYMPLAAGDYQATFEIEYTAPPSADRLLATCDIAHGNEGQRLTSVDVHDVGSGGTLTVVVPFTLSEPTDGMQFRVIAVDSIPIRARGFVVVECTAASKAA